MDDDPSFDWKSHKLEFKLENSKSWGKRKRSLKVKVVKKKCACEATIPPVRNLRNGPSACGVMEPRPMQVVPKACYGRRSDWE